MTSPGGARCSLVPSRPPAGSAGPLPAKNLYRRRQFVSRVTVSHENAERELRQFVWCLPSAPLKLDQTSLEITQIAARIGPWPRGVLPPDATHLTAAVDLGKHLAHWIVVAWSEGATGYVVDYERIEVASDELGVEQAVMAALEHIRDVMKAGWSRADCKEKPQGAQPHLDRRGLHD